MDKKKVARIFIGVIIAAILGIVGYYGYENYYFVSTDDATITGNIYRIAPKIAGKIETVNIHEGDTVQKGQVLMQMEQSNVPTADSAMIKSPIDGVVIQRTGLSGEVVGAGTTVALVVSKKDLYVEANIDETKATDIKVGQPVDITVDMYPGVTFHGKVKEIDPATQSALSLLPPVNAGGNFTKITQRIPVKIAFTDGPYDFKPGLNAEVKIHVK
ncbi:efflux RND transporter periplasmic adaptor subunit [Fodinisporobacter ferrooxydans]|uniref:Efflux RND transporter periplasmic adaptor subunit n=1 Tax=Fodinisporobacter ferrooxydans TaxID=2901836 RepID=A0ABY4CM26_9BACL|nr:efflux RND transporter periplasmic adaptor subunit [Alicyclobacillaceae bacterium MYW30-H2]